MEQRYAIRRVKDEFWEVYEIGSEEVVFVEKVALTNLTGEEALDALELLAGKFLVPGKRRVSSRKS
ncbi:hypothetical protein GA829_19290 [Mesorhizobium sp. INR15]|nr:hypothetical protein GA829_19290 [Mesorhizobium sp. INR15]